MARWVLEPNRGGYVTPGEIGREKGWIQAYSQGRGYRVGRAGTERIQRLRYLGLVESADGVSTHLRPSPRGYALLDLWHGVSLPHRGLRELPDVGPAGLGLEATPGVVDRRRRPVDQEPELELYHVDGARITGGDPLEVGEIAATPAGLDYPDVIEEALPPAAWTRTVPEPAPPAARRRAPARSTPIPVGAPVGELSLLGMAGAIFRGVSAAMRQDREQAASRAAAPVRVVGEVVNRSTGWIVAQQLSDGRVVPLAEPRPPEPEEPEDPWSSAGPLFGRRRY